ncbi:uncharacterized protein LOC130962908 [Arachis stenosperma]|uniref:uncharacterized protein LOC130962908 n=1 Tax=Arachis stenosperma TaxID=217475 RepID=UPI0025AD2713|nr:uncharacterized protein LOC130962908 [Arachis stenosperma]
MRPRRLSAWEGTPNDNQERGQETFMATMNIVAEAVREAAMAAARAVECLGVRNENGNQNGEDNGNNEVDPAHLDKPMTLGTFPKVNPPKFKGTLVATDADNRDEFYKKYFPRAARDAKEIELMQLKQGDMTIAEYARKFDDLCRFSNICQGNPADFMEWKCLKFEGGLREELMNFVVPLEIRNFAELVNKSKLVEECSKKVAIARANRKEASRRDFIHDIALEGRNFKANGQFQRQNENQRNGNFFARYNGNHNNYNLGEEEGGQPQQTQDISVCSRCGKDHEIMDIYRGIAQKGLFEIQLGHNDKEGFIP